MNTLKNTIHLKANLPTKLKLIRHMHTHKNDVAFYRVSIYKYAKVWHCSFDHFTVTEAK